jgi:endonuclease YncB( thermonuclease family)
MKKLILALILLPTFSFAQDFKARYSKNYDGDTITVHLGCDIPLFCNKMSIRVNGIDTPEIRGKCKKEKLLAKKAKDFVKKKIKRSKYTAKSGLELKNCKKGKYFRLVCDVYYKDTSLSKKLIEQNLAVKYDGGKKTKDWCN